MARMALSRLARLAVAYDDATPDEFTLPEDLGALTADELAALEATAIEAIKALREVDDLSAADVEAMEALADSVDLIRTEKTTRAEAQAEVDAKAEDILSRLALDEDENADEAEAVEDDEVVAEDEADEPVAEVDEAIAEAVEAEAEAEVAEAELIAASAAKPRPSKVSLRGLAKRSTKPTEIDTVEDEMPRSTLLASADAPGIQPGSEIDYEKAAEIAMRRHSSVRPSFDAARSKGVAFDQQYGLATLALPKRDFVAGDGQDITKMLYNFRDESQKDVLTAAALCGRPADLGYLPCPGPTFDNMVELPTMSIAGNTGVRYVKGASYDSIFAADVWHEVTPAQQAADDWNDQGSESPKPCFRPECPTETTTEELLVSGICIAYDIPSSRTDLGRAVLADTIEKALVAHRHRLDLYKITDVISKTESVTWDAANDSLTASVLEALELNAHYIRTKYRLSESATLELWLPTWVKGILRADLSRRTGVDLISISDARVNEWLSQRNLRVQFLTNFDPLPTATPLTTWPNTFRAVMFPAGTYTMLEGQEITLTNVFSNNPEAATAAGRAVSLAFNGYTALFTEQFYDIVELGCYDGLTITFSNVCADGASKLPEDIACNAAT